MATQGDSLIRKTQKGLSVLAFETTKQSRILKKRMRIAALQKEVKADLRDLGSLVYNSILHDQPGILEEEEVKLLVEGIRLNREEIEHLRDGIARMNRAHKHFDTEPPGEAPPPPPKSAAAEPVAEPDLEPAKNAPPPEQAPSGAAATPEEPTPAEAEKPKRTPKRTPKPKTTKAPAGAKTAAPKAAKRKPAARKKTAAPKAPPAEPASDEASGDAPEKKDDA